MKSFTYSIFFLIFSIFAFANNKFENNFTSNAPTKAYILGGKDYFVGEYLFDKNNKDSMFIKNEDMAGQILSLTGHLKFIKIQEYDSVKDFFKKCLMYINDPNFKINKQLILKGTHLGLEDENIYCITTSIFSKGNEFILMILYYVTDNGSHAIFEPITPIFMINNQEIKHEEILNTKFKN